MNRTKIFFYNFISTTILNCLLMFVGFILPIVIIKCYGSDVNGLITSITQFISYFNLVEAGLASAAVYSLYVPLSKKDNKKISEVVSTAKHFYFLSGYIFTILVFLLALIYPFFVNLNSFSYLDLFFLVLIIGFNGCIDFFAMAKYRVLFTADQKTYIISIISIIYYILNTAIIIVLSYFKINIILVRLVALLSIILKSLLLYVYGKKHYKNIEYNLKSNKKLIDKRWDALYLQILGVIQNATPVILLTFFTNLITVSIYTVYNMVIQGINSILSVFTNGLYTSFGDIIAKKETNKLQETSKEFEYIYYNLLIIIYSCSFALIMPFISIYASNLDTNYYFPLVGFLFVLNGLLYNLKTPQGMLVMSAGLYKETKWQTTFQGLLIIFIGIILTPKYKIVGILIALIISNLYRDIDLLIFIPKKLTHLSISTTLKKQIKLFVLMGIIIYIYSNIDFQIYNYIDWCLSGVVILVISFLVIIVNDFIFDREDLKKFFNRIKMLLKI